MIKLATDKMKNAIAKAKATRLRVRVISAADRTYSVTGSRGDLYIVRFAVDGGR